MSGASYLCAGCYKMHNRMKQVNVRRELRESFRKHLSRKGCKPSAQLTDTELGEELGLFRFKISFKKFSLESEEALDEAFQSAFDKELERVAESAPDTKEECEIMSLWPDAPQDVLRKGLGMELPQSTEKEALEAAVASSVKGVTTLEGYLNIMREVAALGYDIHHRVTYAQPVWENVTTGAINPQQLVVAYRYGEAEVWGGCPLDNWANAFFLEKN